jgi:hypothetical protein
LAFEVDGRDNSNPQDPQFDVLDVAGNLVWLVVVSLSEQCGDLSPLYQPARLTRQDASHSSGTTVPSGDESPPKVEGAA